MLGNERNLTDSELLETVSRLYGLRGGLSIISQEKQKIDELGARFDKYMGELKYKKIYRDSIERALEYNKKVSRKVFSIMGVILFSVISIISFIGSYYSWQWFYHWWILHEDVKHFLLGLSSPMLILLTLAIGIATIVGIVIKIKEIISSNIFVKERGVRLLNESKVEIGYIEEEIEEVAKEKEEIVQNCKAVYQALIVEYQDLLDARDWKMLDLLIFYFETGRACSRAEALQLADRQVSENEMKEALHQVEQTINNSTDMIVRMMIECTGVLSESIGEMGAKFSQSMSQLTSSVNAQTALLNNANKPSPQLVEDISAMRRIWEDKERRELNHIN